MLEFDINGFDGNPHTPALTQGICGVLDLTNNDLNIGTYGWVISLEVGEHIPKEFEQRYLDNITKAAKFGVILSWAVVGQDGHGHVNCQNNDYIIAEMAKRGFTYSKIESEHLRKSATLSWFKNTLMVFIYG